MKILVAVASKHGATAAIGDEIARQLRQELAAGPRRGADPVEVELRDAADIADVAGYDAAVIGSAVYAGKWRKPARNFVRRHAVELRAIPVWLFSSGPIGDPLGPDTVPVDVDTVSDLAGAIEHRIFAGELDRATLGMCERAIVSALGVAEGDYRDWAQVRQWARSIAATLRGREIAPQQARASWTRPS